MKKLSALFLALVMSLLLVTCIAEEIDENDDGPFGKLNRVVEYDSLEEINTIIGVNLMHPAVMGVTNERFSVIDDTVAQYVCEINGLEWTFRGAYITDEDISGMYSEYSGYALNSDLSLYTDRFYMDRFFDGERQYTIVVMDPITADGDVFLDEETFSNICMELELIQKLHMDDPLVGDYRDTVSKRVTAIVERRGDAYNIDVNWSDSAFEYNHRIIYGAVREDDKLSYYGEEIVRYTYDAEGNETSCNATGSDNPGWFEIKDGMLYWTGSAYEENRACVFERIAFEE